MKKTLLLTLIAILAISAVGLTYADEPVRPLGICTGENAEAYLAQKIEMLQTLVTEGKITQAEADALITQLENCDGNQRQILKNFFNEKFGENSGYGFMGKRGAGGKGRSGFKGQCPSL